MQFNRIKEIKNQIMNKKFLLIGMTVLLAAGLACVGRAVYRARHNLVTIDVYNAPLTAVIKQLERQTRETILLGKGLEAKVTLAVKNLPLDEVLDKLGQQVGANWSKWHAVHGSERALNQLETALRDRTKIEEVGWTNIAPQGFAGGPGLQAAAGGADTSPVDVGGCGGRSGDRQSRFGHAAADHGRRRAGFGKRQQLGRQNGPRATADSHGHP